MMSYNPQGLLASADTNLVPVLLFGALTLISMFICFGEALRLGFKEKTYAIPVAANFYFLAHDYTYVSEAHKWFYEIGHWFPIFFWVALCGTCIFETLFLFQSIHYGHRELCPQLSKRMLAILMIATQMAVFVMFWCVKRAMADELYFINFAVTITWLMPFSLGLAVRRKSQQGQSPLLIGAAIGLALFFWITTWFLDPYFHSPIWIALGCVTVLWGCVNLGLLNRFPKYTPTERDSITI